MTLRIRAFDVLVRLVERSTSTARMVRCRGGSNSRGFMSTRCLRFGPRASRVAVLRLTEMGECGGVVLPDSRLRVSRSLM